MKKILFHVDEMSKWNLTIKNVLNMLDYYEKEGTIVQLEIVANSEAVSILTDNIDLKLVKSLQKLANKKVVIAFCNNAIQAFHIEQAQIPDWISIVAAGVVEIAEKQLEGYAYIKP